MNNHYISDKHLSLEKINYIIQNKIPLQLSKESEEKIKKCRTYLDQKLLLNKESIYGINTGFGSLCNTKINFDQLHKLQENLIKSHACGVGEKCSSKIVKLMLLLKIQSLSYGHSGVRVATVKRLIDFYNHEIYPIIYEQGSLGASGDLAPLAHLCLPLIGFGEVEYKGKIMTSKDILKQFDWEPLSLQSKEGLALLNGTQFMLAYAIWNILTCKQLLNIANHTGAISLDAYNGRIEPFSELPHKIRNHKGQQVIAKIFRTLLSDSTIIKQEKKHVQDPYSFRCIPQVHGASYDCISYIESIITNEINAVTDNPIIFPNEDKIISAGNFHGQPLALLMDMLGIAIAEIGSISERRIYKLIGGERNLPTFLISNPGLNSGFMILQYTAASIVSQNKQLCTPASVDTIDSSNGQEDHVSMGANAATKCMRIIKNVEKIIAIELINSAQALEFRRPLKTSSNLENIISDFRKIVPFHSEDTVFYNTIFSSIQFIQNYHFK